MIFVISSRYEYFKYPNKRENLFEVWIMKLLTLHFNEYLDKILVLWIR